MTPYITGEFTVSTIRRARINEIFFDENGEKWYKAKLYFISLDEDKGIEKRTATTMLVQANDTKEANEGIVKGMKASMADYQIASVTETQILDVYLFDAVG